MDSRNIFWGLICKPGKRYETEVQEAFRMTKVRFVSQSVLKNILTM